MNTPAHVAVNLVVFGRKHRPELNVPILLGSLLPDLPIIVFYMVEKLYRNLPESVIWSDAYYRPGWQAFIDVFNSIPLALAGWLVFTDGSIPGRPFSLPAWRCTQRWIFCCITTTLIATSCR
ncbi:hypothetical protein D3OALGB2SA_1648 [Olavius algarvensis associated proteobacterium Delta 3]|nr:hypothetical protein D3OALGB2SA_1648 [Olavius algarvensis associated proteobacterium Delta 3]